GPNGNPRALSETRRRLFGNPAAPRPPTHQNLQSPRQRHVRIRCAPLLAACDRHQTTTQPSADPAKNQRQQHREALKLLSIPSSSRDARFCPCITASCNCLTSLPGLSAVPAERVCWRHLRGDISSKRRKMRLKCCTLPKPDSKAISEQV